MQVCLAAADLLSVCTVLVQDSLSGAKIPLTTLGKRNSYLSVVGTDLSLKT